MKATAIGQQNLEELVYWGLRLREDLGNHETEWKLRGYKRLSVARSALVEGRPEWRSLLLSALQTDPKHPSGGLQQLVAWQMVDRFKKEFLDADPTRAEALLRTLWSEQSDWPQSMVPLLSALQPIHAGLGYRLSLVAALAGATNPDTRVPYKDKHYRNAYRLTGYPQSPKSSDALAVYQHALSFLDAVASESAALGVPATRLQAHDIAWYALKYGPPTSWTPEDVAALAQFRGEAGGGEALADVTDRDLKELALDVETPEDAEYTCERTLRAILDRSGQPEFRATVGKAYSSRCAITDYDCPEALEAAHIVAVAHGGADHVSNGMLLRADLHTLFDRGLLAIDSETWKVVLAPRLRGGSYEPLHGAQFRRPDVASYTLLALRLRAHLKSCQF